MTEITGIGMARKRQLQRCTFYPAPNAIQAAEADIAMVLRPFETALDRYAPDVLGVFEHGLADGDLTLRPEGQPIGGARFQRASIAHLEYDRVMGGNSGPMYTPRCRIKTLMIVVAVVAFALFGQRIYRDGIDSRWLVLKLRYGNVEARRSAAIQAHQWEGKALVRGVLSGGLSGSTNPNNVESQRRYRKRRADLLLPALIRTTKDSDLTCRVHALKTLGFLATIHGSEPQKELAVRHILVAMRDREACVRTAAVSSLAGLAERDRRPVIRAIRSALADPSVEVRRAAALELGMLGVIVPTSQSEVASILVPLLASEEDTRVRVQAAWALCYFGVDGRRHPASGPDVVPALVVALRDPTRRHASRGCRDLGVHEIGWPRSTYLPMDLEEGLDRSSPQRGDP